MSAEETGTDDQTAGSARHSLADDARRPTETKPTETKPTETEATLLIVADEPAEVGAAVASLSELGGFVFEQRPDQAIRDRYFDTPDGRLAAAGTALRLRQLDSMLLLTIKGPARFDGRGTKTRTEQEQSWPADAWALLRAELGDELAVPGAPPEPSDPVASLRSAGLVVVQDRETSRHVRAVVPAGAERPVAELAVDSVVYHLAAAEVRHHEIEVEAKAAGGDSAAAALAGHLVERFGPSLRPWHHGKLATGAAAAALLEEHGRERLLAPDGSLRPSSYDAIAGRLTLGDAGDGAHS